MPGNFSMTPVALHVHPLRKWSAPEVLLTIAPQLASPSSSTHPSVTYGPGHDHGITRALCIVARSVAAGTVKKVVEKSDSPDDAPCRPISRASEANRRQGVVAHPGALWKHIERGSGSDSGSNGPVELNCERSRK